MSEVCKTVRVKTDNEQGFKVINECDFVEGEHELFTEAKSVEEQPAKKVVEDPESAKKAPLQRKR